MSEYGNVIFIYHKTSLYSLQLKATEKHGSGICANYSRWFLSIHTVFKGLYIANVSKSLASTYIPPPYGRGFPLVTVLRVMFMVGGEDVIDTKMSSVSLFSYQLMVGLPLVYLIVIMFY